MEAFCGLCLAGGEADWGTGTGGLCATGSAAAAAYDCNRCGGLAGIM